MIRAALFILWAMVLLKCLEQSLQTAMLNIGQLAISKCQARSATAQRNHIAMALRTFLRLETYSYTTGDSWFEAKIQIIRDAIRHYLVSPRYNLLSTA
jgi:hypothetical protein